SIGSLTLALYQSIVPVIPCSCGRRNGERKARPRVQVSPRSFSRFGLPTTNAAPPPTSQSFMLTWNSDALLPPQALIIAAQRACNCARTAGSVVSVLFTVVPCVGPGNVRLKFGLFRHGSVG